MDVARDEHPSFMVDFSVAICLKYETQITQVFAPSGRIRAAIDP